MGRIKILYIIGSYGVGGKERQLAELIKGLPKNEYSLSFIVKNSDAYYLQSIKNDLDYFYSLEEKRFGLRSLFKIYKKIKDIRPDIVHCWASIATVQTIIIGIFLNFKLIDGSIRDSITPGLKSKFIRFVINLFADRIIANSKAGLLCYKIPFWKSAFIHNGFDFNRIIGLEPSEKIKSEFNIQSTKVVGMVARIDFQKDYPTFIKAAEIILLKNTDVKFVIVGDGEDKEKIQSMIDSKHKEKFIFTGRQSNVEAIINCFDIAVLATFSEGISNSILEYMALEKPVVVTNGGGTSELVKEGVTGYLVRQGDAYQMARKISFLLDHQAICLRMGIEGGKHIIEDFNFRKMIDGFQNEYNNLISN
jgi:glycosyltransferase involved in cell wall biosynthesis